MLVNFGGNPMILTIWRKLEGDLREMEIQMKESNIESKGLGVTKFYLV